MKTVKTPKGTDLPLISLKGKDYLQVAHRLMWFNEEAAGFDIQTNILRADKDESVVQARITLLDAEGKVLKSTTATKREDAKGFADHLEKAETGAIGRALALMGFGTQFAVNDLDEGDRIVDSPVINLKTATKEVSVPVVPSPAPAVEAPKANSFRKPKKPEAAPVVESEGGWQ